MTTAQAVITNHVRFQLNDPDGITWTNAQLLALLNDAQRSVCSVKPDAYVKNTTMAKAAGSKQTLPTGALTLTDVIRNLDGATPGRAITKIPKRILDVQRPGWHNEPPQAESKSYVFDPKDQKHFYLHPPSNGTGQVEIVYPATPEDIALDDSILIDDNYIPALVHNVCARAYSVDAGYAADDARAAAHDNRFMALLSGKEAGERASEPKNRIGRANRTVGEE